MSRLNKENRRFGRVAAAWSTIVLALVLVGCEEVSLLEQTIRGAVFADQLYTITITRESMQPGEPLDSSHVTSAAAGTLVTLTGTVNASRKITLSSTGVTLSETKFRSSGETSTFTMPEGDVIITGAFAFLEIPAAPENITKSWVGSSMYVTWDDVSNNEQGFQIYSNKVLVPPGLCQATGSLVAVVDVPPNYDNYFVSGLCDATAAIDVRAFNDDGVSGSTNPVY